MRDIKTDLAEKRFLETSLQLIRTNPKLSGNVKLIVDSKGDCFLSTFDRIPELSSNSMKRYPYNVTKTYGENLANFKRDTKIQRDQLFRLFESKIDLSVEKTFSKQRDDLYWKGCFFKDSSLYDERLSCLAPIWLRKEIPQKFIIFESNDPFSPNGLDETISEPNDLQTWINDYRIIKTIDLGPDTKIGKVLRSIVENDRFSTDPLFVSYKDNFIEYIGWDCDKGSLTSYIENTVRDLTNIDHAILEREDQLIRGFSRGNLVVSNLLNIEFLFDTNEFNTTNRYFGLFADFDEIDDFIIDDSRAEEDKRNQYWVKDLWNNQDCSDRIVENQEGVKIYYELKSAPLLEESDIETKRIFTIKDANENLYSIKQPWESVLQLPNNPPLIDDEYLRIKNQELNISNLCGFQESFSDEKTSLPEVNILPNIRIKLLKNPEDGDQIRIYITDILNNLIDIHTITATDTIPLGTSLGNQFSNLGNIDNCVEAIINCISYLYETYYNFGFIAERIEPGIVLIKSTVDSTLRNGADVELWTSGFESVFEVLENSYKPDTFSFTPSPVLSSPVVTTGILIKARMRGFTGQSAIVSESFIKRFQQSERIDGKEFFIRNKNNLNQFIQLNFTGESYYETALFTFDYNWKKLTGKNRIVFIDNNLWIPSTFKFTLYERIRNRVGLLSNYYLVDFDFDSYSEEYSNGISGDRIKFLEFLTTGSVGSNQTLFPPTVSNLSDLESIYGDDSEYVINGSEYRLNDFNIDIEDIETEYNRLQENSLKETAVISKVVPWITKWTKRGLDVRNNESRFTGGPSFGVSNFSPSFKEFTSNPKFHTHEWFLLTGLPPYELDNNSYLDYINGDWDSDLHLILDDYFSDKIRLNEFNGQENELRFLSSRISKARTGFFETFFRGVTVRFKKKTTLNSINFNIDGLKLDQGFDFDDYEFIAIITKGGPGFKLDITRNDRSKSIVLDLNCDFFDDIVNGYLDAGLVLQYYMDRTQFYQNTSKFVYDAIDNELQPSDITISGAILSWTITGGEYQFIGGRNDGNGTDPNFAAEIFPNSDGSYNPILITIGTDVLEISGITNVTSNTIIATDLVLNSSIPITVDSVTLGSSATYGFIIALLPFGDYVYPEGGFDFYRRLTDDISFANIAEKINTGDPEISYRASLIDGQIVENDFFLELVEPDMIINNLYIKPEEDERPSTLRNEYGSIGSRLVNQKNLESYVFFRTNGFYSPKFKKLSLFSIEPLEISNLPNSIGRLHRFFNDNILHSLWHNKVSENSFDSILSGDRNSDFQPLYPKIDEVCIARADFNCLRSNWDYGILKESLSKSLSKNEWGIFAFPNLRLFLGNVLILARNEYLFDVFTDFDESNENLPPQNLDLLDIKTSDSLYYQRVKNKVEFTVNVNKLLMESIYEEFGFLIDFLQQSVELESRIINKFGNLDNFIKEIIIQELLQRYEVSSVNVYKKTVNLTDFDDLTESFSDFDLTVSESEKLSEFQLDNINSNFTFTNSNRRNFILNIPSKVGEGFIKSFSFTVKIR